MKPDTIEIHTQIGNKLGSQDFTIVSCKFVGDTNQWVARVEDNINEKKYYRIAEGLGKNVTFVSTRMPFNVATFRSQQGSPADRNANREIRQATLETLEDQHQRESTQIEFNHCLDRLFEGRDD